MGHDDFKIAILVSTPAALGHFGRSLRDFGKAWEHFRGMLADGRDSKNYDFPYVFIGVLVFWRPSWQSWKPSEFLFPWLGGATAGPLAHVSVTWDVTWEA